MLHYLAPFSLKFILPRFDQKCRSFWRPWTSDTGLCANDLYQDIWIDDHGRIHHTWYVAGGLNPVNEDILDQIPFAVAVQSENWVIDSPYVDTTRVLCQNGDQWIVGWKNRLSPLVEVTQAEKVIEYQYPRVPTFSSLLL